MTDENARFFAANGADMIESDRLPPSAATNGMFRRYFELRNECPFFSRADANHGTCTIYNDPRRPQACADFVAGGDACQEIRSASDSQT